MAVQISGNDITVPRDGSFTRNVTIGGTLTYEDVTNIDSVGLVTARNGIEIGARPGVAASISVDGNMIVSGISTVGELISYYGTFVRNVNDNGLTIARGNASNSGANVTVYGGSHGSYPDTVRFRIDGSEKARIDGSGRLLLGTTTEGEASADDLTIAGSGNQGITIRSGTSNYGLIYFSDATSGTGEYDGAIEYKHSDNFMVFRTGASERLRIDSSGHMGLGVTPNSNWPSNDDFKALQIGTGACVFGRGSGDDDRAGLAANYYATGSGNAYLANGHANLIYLNDGNINCYTASQNSSGAGAAMSLVEVLSVNTNGYVTKPKNLCLSYTSSSSQNITSRTLIYATEVFDVGDSNAYNTSTGVFTAPITGIYNIYHEYYNVTGYNAMTKLEKSTNSGSSFSQIKIFGRQRNDNAYTSAGFSHLVQANANDQFKITWYDGQVHINNTFTNFQVQLVQ